LPNVTGLLRQPACGSFKEGLLGEPSRAWACRGRGGGRPGV